MRNPLQALENIGHVSCKIRNNDDDIIRRATTDEIRHSIESDAASSDHTSSPVRNGLAIGYFENGYFILPNDCNDDQQTLSNGQLLNEDQFVNAENVSPTSVLQNNDDRPVSIPLTVNQIFKRTLSFKNLIIGDECLGIINPVLLDPDRETYVKTIGNARIQNVLQFVLTTRFINVRNVIFHVGSNDINKDFLSVCDVAKRIQLMIHCSAHFSPHSMVYYSLPLPVFDEETSRLRTSLLHMELIKLCKPLSNVALLKHSNIIRQNGKCAFDKGPKFTNNPADNLFIRNLRSILGIEDNHQVFLDI
ncbi:hypothetical protein GJ496_002760 [Pomphorhynchus laevis]|nr:hypothetical protein GJ496_002760 [Pomphorhynchus laevis]